MDVEQSAEWVRGKTQSTRKRPAPVPLCQPQIPHDLTRARRRAAAVRSRRLTAWATERLNALLFIRLIWYYHGTRGSAVGWGTVLQAGRSRTRDPMWWMNFSIYVVLPVALGPGVYSASNRSRKKCFWGVERGRCVRLAISPPSLSRLSRQCGILYISEPYRASRSVMGIGLLLLFLLFLSLTLMLGQQIDMMPKGSSTRVTPEMNFPVRAVGKLVRLTDAFCKRSLTPGLYGQQPTVLGNFACPSVSTVDTNNSQKALLYLLSAQRWITLAFIPV
jgi:hypothetical protein